MLYDDSTAGQTYELYGPKEYSMAEIAEFADREIFKKRRHINLPKAVLKPIAGLLNKYLWWHTMSADEVEREFIDQEIDETAKTFKDLGIEPGDISKFTYHYLVRTPVILSIKVACVDFRIARFPQCQLLRPAPCNREGEEGGAQVPARS